MDRNAFEKMASTLRPRVLSRALAVLGDRDEAEDVAQETLLKLWSLRDRLDTFDSVEGFALIIARNRCIDLLRRAGNDRAVPLDGFDVAEAAFSPEEEIIETEEGRRLSRIIDGLPEGQRIVLTMKHVDGLEVEEIARLTGSNVNAIRVTLSRARHRVKDIFLNR